MSEEDGKNICKTCGPDGLSLDGEVEEQNQKDEETVDFKIYDVPVELKNKYVSLAKLEHDNDVWKVLQEGMKRLEEERETKVPKLEARIEMLEEKVELLRRQITKNEEQEKEQDVDAPPETFGGN